MTDISVILPGEFKYGIKFCRQITNFRIMVDFMQKMHVFETAIFATFGFRTPSRIQQVADPHKPIYF